MTVCEGLNTLLYNFMSAWSSPVPVIAALSGMFPTATIDIRFREDGNNVRGHLVFRNGKAEELPVDPDEEFFAPWDIEEDQGL